MTTVYLFDSPFDDSGKHLLIPKERNAEGFLKELLSVLTYKRYDNVTWERQGQTFRCPVRADELKRYNYMAYQNESRIEFAYIIDYQYVNNKLTYVNTSVDYWATYIDKFTFHPSPIIRQHPPSDGLFANFYPEPTQVDRWEIARTEYGFSKDDDDSVYLMTANNTDTYENRSSDFYAAIANFAMGDYGQINNFFSLVSVNPCECGGIVQSNTSKLSRAQALEVVKRYAKCGRQEDIIGAYHVPKFFATEVSGENLDKVDNRTGEVELVQSFVEKPLWNKLYTSPQFNKLTVNCGGSAKEYDFRYFDESALLAKKFKFKWAANQSQLGGIVITPQQYGNGTNGDYSLASSTWDSVQLSTTQLNNSGVMRDFGNFGVASIGNLFSLDIKGELQAAETFAENLGAKFEESDLTIGNPTGTIAMYNALFPMISVAWYYPSLQDIRKFNNYFCMYGYNYNGSLADIVIDSLPIVNYVHTSGAIITAENAPQNAIAYMANRLDSGVWFWHGIGNYKHTDKILENHFPESEGG